MYTKDFIDGIYRDSNGALTRSEILKKTNTCQNWMFSRNCTEMDVQSTFTLASEVTAPVYGTMATSNQGNYSGATVDYVPGDTFVVSDNFTTGIGAYTSYYRVLAPFTSSVATFYSDIPKYCTLCTYYEHSRGNIATVAYDTGATWAVGNTIVYQGDYYVAHFGCASASGVFATDANTYRLVLTFASPLITGTVVTATEAVPEYIELAGVREVVAVGLKDSDNEYTTTYYPKIQQSPDPLIPCKIYTAGLPEGVAISYNGYRWPTQLTTENIALEVPEAHQEGLLRTKVMRSIEEANFGNSVYWNQIATVQEGDWFNYINRSKTNTPRRRVTQRYNPLAGMIIVGIMLYSALVKPIFAIEPNKEQIMEMRTHPTLNILVADDGSLIVNKDTNKVLSQFDNNGYLRVGITTSPYHQEKFAVHRLVMETYIGESELAVNHIDGVKTNNVVGNLEYVSNKENSIHAVNTGLMTKNCRKIVGTFKDGTKIEFDSLADASRHCIGDTTGKGNIGGCLSGRIDSAYGYRWEYNDDKLSHRIPITLQDINSDELVTFSSIAEASKVVGLSGIYRLIKGTQKTAKGYCLPQAG